MRIWALIVVFKKPAQQVHTRTARHRNRVARAQMPGMPGGNDQAERALQ